MQAAARGIIPGLLILLVWSCANNSKQKIIVSEAELGEELFFDPVLSRDSSVSCASCHRPDFAFADTLPVSRGMGGQAGTRNTPSAMNQSERNAYFWDGRAATLEEQALGPMENHVEMDFPLTLTVKRLIKHNRYKQAFLNVYGALPNKELLAKAIAAYERTLETSQSRFDRYFREDDTLALDASEKRGLAIFNTKGKCFDCHFGVDFTGNDQFKNIGLYNGKDLNDKGRYLVTENPKDLGAFKIPGLRNIAQTAPYMHNGMFRTLKQVIEYYNNPDAVVSNSINRDSLLAKPLGLTEGEMTDLENFLRSLSDARFMHEEITGKN